MIGLETNAGTTIRDLRKSREADASMMINTRRYEISSTA